MYRERVTSAPRNALPGRRRSGTGPGSFGKPHRASVEVESASARCRSRAPRRVHYSAPAPSARYAPPAAHQRRAWRRTVSQRHPPPEAGTTHVLIGHAWPLVHSPSAVIDSNTPAGGARQGQTGAWVAPPCLPTRPIWTRWARCSGGRTCTTHPVGRRRAERAQRERRGSARGRGR
jgi:hypothetical protein